MDGQLPIHRYPSINPGHPFIVTPSITHNEQESQILTPSIQEELLISIEDHAI
jgi:hypothetical protein